jgi:hypothetical protein
MRNCKGRWWAGFLCAALIGVGSVPVAYAEDGKKPKELELIRNGEKGDKAKVFVLRLGAEEALRGHLDADNKEDFRWEQFWDESKSFDQLVVRFRFDKDAWDRNPIQSVSLLLDGDHHGKPLSIDSESENEVAYGITFDTPPKLMLKEDDPLVEVVVEAPRKGVRHAGLDLVFIKFGPVDYQQRVVGGAALAAMDVASVEVIPEPETYALMGAGLAMVGVMASRRRRRLVS